MSTVKKAKRTKSIEELADIKSDPTITESMIAYRKDVSNYYTNSAAGRQIRSDVENVLLETFQDSATIDKLIYEVLSCIPTLQNKSGKLAFTPQLKTKLAELYSLADRHRMMIHRGIMLINNSKDETVQPIKTMPIDRLRPSISSDITDLIKKPK